ncbi:MAG: hypothetical protein GX072_13220, partial [Lysinibacillus sp.]|nr:hypothetical protein [Lysinibacillus sp.]
YNEHKNLDRLAETLKNILKIGLKEKNYHLSGVIFKGYEQKVSAKVSDKKRAQTTEEDRPVKKGVDIRI